MKIMGEWHNGRMVEWPGKRPGKIVSILSCWIYENQILYLGFAVWNIHYTE